MKLKLDENIPQSAATRLAAVGYDVNFPVWWWSLPRRALRADREAKDTIHQWDT